VPRRAAHPDRLRVARRAKRPRARRSRRLIMAKTRARVNASSRRRADKALRLPCSPQSHKGTQRRTEKKRSTDSRMNTDPWATLSQRRRGNSRRTVSQPLCVPRARRSRALALSLGLTLMFSWPRGLCDR
jgi:hypothetical protein